MARKVDTHNCVPCAILVFPFANICVGDVGTRVCLDLAEEAHKGCCGFGRK